jgi:hypothetical protein
MGILVNKGQIRGCFMVQRILLVAVLVFNLGLTTGCSVRLATMSFEDERLQSLPRRDMSEMSVQITKSKEDPNKVRISHINNSKIQLSEPCRMKYQSFYFDLIDLVAVTGTLPNDKKYTAFLDTGHPGYVVTNSLTVLENNLVIYPLGEVAGYSSYMGFCELPSLQLGQAVITDPPCAYLQQQWEVRLLGLPIWQQRGFLLGLGLLRDFGYIVFDNTKKEVELALTEIFAPDKPEQWDSYPLEIKMGRLIVNIPVEGQNYDLMFDSCGRYGMVVGPDFCEKLPLKVNSGKIRDGKFQSGFLGELPCRKTNIKNLKIGNVMVKNAEILILPEDSPYIRAVNSISIKFFKKTVVVMDFENSLLWIKKPESRQP